MWTIREKEKEIMDTSKEYIQMCDCIEVQGQWKLPPQGGDRFYVKTGYYSNGAEPGNGEYWVDEGEIAVLNGGDSCHPDDVDRFIFLPRQDQIQEMMGLKPHGNTWAWLEEFWVGFYEFYSQFFEYQGRDIERNTIDYARQFKSMEQLWLAFYMQEKHSKAWNGERWVIK